MKQRYFFILFVFPCLVGAFAYDVSPARVFGGAHGVALTIGFISAAIFGTSTSVLKLITTHKTWLYNTSPIKSHRWWCHFIRGLSIVLATALVGILMYYISFDVTTMEYSESLWNGFRVFAGIAAGIMTVLPLGLSKL